MRQRVGSGDDEGVSGLRTAWFHCFSGIAGDMALGALLDAGAQLDEVRSMLGRLPVQGWSLEAESVLRSGIGGTKVHVRASDTSVVRTAAHIVALVEEARLPDRVRERSLATFNALAAAEGRLHRRPPEQVHFHEVGGIDAIVDVVGTCSALEVLGIDEVVVSPVATGIGMVRSAHGLIPNPAPATLELLRGAPTYAVDVSVELTTPTGAALASALAVDWGPLPAMTIASVGFGAGDADLGDRPNLLQVVVGDHTAAITEGVPLVSLEVNVDDATGETLAHAVAELLSAGANDAWVTPIVMKKGRPAYTVSAVADPALAGQVARVLAAETGSLGVRGLTLQRWPLARSFDEVEVDGLAVRVKVGPGRVKVEHDDAARVARRTGRPLREVVARAEAAWLSQSGKPAGTPETSAGLFGPAAGRGELRHVHEHHTGDHHDHRLDQSHDREPPDGEAG